MLKALAILILCVVPTDLVARDYCTRIERNHFFDDCGHKVFTQIVAWDESHVFFWRMEKPEANIRITQHGADWCLRFTDGDLHREVWAGSFDESWTQTDVELDNRTQLPVEQRRRLKGAR